jgi:formyl-CoA transferase
MDLPLSDVRVVDLTQFEAGPTATQALAWLGADVIKVEPPRGEPGRHLAGATRERVSAFFLFMNQSKRSVVLDLREPAGLEALLALLATADVLAENFAPGTLERLGLGAETLERRFPRLVIASVRGYRAGGPWSEWKSLDMVAQATGGAISITGESGRPPVRMGPTNADHSAGMHLALGIVAALHRRARTGRGGRVEVALQDVVVSSMRTAFTQHFVSGAPAQRRGADYPDSSPSGLFPCAPGGPNDWVYLLLSNTEQWQALVAAIERPDLLEDARFARQSLRNQNDPALREIVSSWTRRHAKLDVMTRLSSAGVPCGAVLDTGELLANEHLRKTGMIVPQRHPEWGDVWLPGCPIRMDGFEPRLEPAPALGAHTDEVLASLGGKKETAP